MIKIEDVTTYEHMLVNSGMIAFTLGLIEHYQLYYSGSHTFIEMLDRVEQVVDAIEPDYKEEKFRALTEIKKTYDNR